MKIRAPKYWRSQVVTRESMHQKDNTIIGRKRKEWLLSQENNRTAADQNPKQGHCYHHAKRRVGSKEQYTHDQSQLIKGTPYAQEVRKLKRFDENGNEARAQALQVQRTAHAMRKDLSCPPDSEDALATSSCG